jgi:hypothetical protein
MHATPSIGAILQQGNTVAAVNSTEPALQRLPTHSTIRKKTYGWYAAKCVTANKHNNQPSILLHYTHPALRSTAARRCPAGRSLPRCALPASWACSAHSRPCSSPHRCCAPAAAAAGAVVHDEKWHATHACGTAGHRLRPNCPRRQSHTTHKASPQTAASQRAVVCHMQCTPQPFCVLPMCACAAGCAPAC